MIKAIKVMMLKIISKRFSTKTSAPAFSSADFHLRLGIFALNAAHIIRAGLFVVYVGHVVKVKGKSGKAKGKGKLVIGHLYSIELPMKRSSTRANFKSSNSYSFYTL